EREQAAATEALEQARVSSSEFQVSSFSLPERETRNAKRETPPEAALAAAQEGVRTLEGERRGAEAAVTELRVRLAQQEQRLQGAVAAARRAAEGGAFLDRQRADRLRE